VPDVVVVGGGPVGLSAALYAVRSGLSVTVLEPRTGLLDKACGEGLMPGAVAALAGLGVEPPGRDLLGIRYTSGSRAAVADFPGGPGRGVRRTALRAALHDAAHAAGVEVVLAGATDVVQDADGVRVATREPSGRPGPVLAARYVLAADGLHSARPRPGAVRPTAVRPASPLRDRAVVAPRRGALGRHG
jgi:2-polyprenyl-6-methoxyphenol hydroxylase-like FAD-dependent oxidoreductase